MMNSIHRLADLVSASTMAPDGRRDSVVQTLLQLACLAGPAGEIVTLDELAAAYSLLAVAREGDTPQIAARRRTCAEIAELVPVGDLASAVPVWESWAALDASDDPRLGAIRATAERELAELREALRRAALDRLVAATPPEIKNFTPHAVTLFAASPEGLTLPSEGVARCAMRTVDVATSPVREVREVLGPLEGLPPPEHGVIYLVSRIAAEAASAEGRTDVRFPALVQRDVDGVPSYAMALGVI